jgi:hypothetical protein
MASATPDGSQQKQYREVMREAHWVLRRLVSGERPRDSFSARSETRYVPARLRREATERRSRRSKRSSPSSVIRLLER